LAVTVEKGDRSTSLTEMVAIRFAKLIG